ncbi:MAG: glycosyltransferase family 39 protein [Saprospiraceae bacterium]|nr:glycosyltransferase family 39 protein [Saprospiraceae bacterium]
MVGIKFPTFAVDFQTTMERASITRIEKYLWVLAVLMVLPALLTNLGMMPFIDDEAIRALVAYEMDLSGNYIVPTLNGETYLNKPPLYNWILLGFFHLFGRYDEFVSRFATVVSSIGFAITIFLVFRKWLNTRVAILSAFLFLTCGRILLYDSMLGLIDITFSWVTFLGIYSVYHFYKKEQWYALFLVSYLLAAAGFMMKGLPSVVFQGSTLLVFFIWKRDWRRFISLPHVLGGLLFLLLVGGYYYVYSLECSVDEALLNLFSESTKRTATEYGIGRTILHLFTFPFEMLYHFLPWSILAIIFLSRRTWARIRQQEFLQFLILMFLANIIPYWISVEVYPRYILMLVPLFFGVVASLYQDYNTQEGYLKKTLEVIYFIFLLLLTFSASLPFWYAETPEVSYLNLKAGFLLGSLLCLIPIYYKFPVTRLTVIVLALLIGRLGFDWFVLPQRLENDWGQVCKTSTIEAIEIAEIAPIIYENTSFQVTNSFYATITAQDFIRRQDPPFEVGELIIFDPNIYVDFKYEEICRLYLRFKKREQILGRFLGYNDIRENPED